jgi:hypothetical protein
MLGWSDGVDNYSYSPIGLKMGVKKMANISAGGFAGAYVPSPNPDVREQVRAYETSNGAAAPHWKGDPWSS